ncbi:MAG: prolipoprotein diacylglyceryl transferase [Synergistaceae bacterium]|nr:prolipoprotein diacylglyceryl transferase [Synergistaceae bacterium]
MLPVLFKIGNIEIQTYYVFWGIALISAMLWTNKRTDKSGLPVKESSSVISYALIGMILGSRCFEYFTNWRMYYDNPAFILDINRGGVSEVGAIISAMIIAFIMCRVKKISFWRLSEAVSPAVLLTMAIGRWGCFLNGCCAGVPGHPTQLYYSFSAAIILSIVLMVENYNSRTGTIFKYGTTTPIGLGLYSISRILIDQYRVEVNTSGMIASERILIVCAVISLVWIIVSIIKRTSRVDAERGI